MTDLLTASATDLARRIRMGEVTSAQVVGAHIEHARRVNPVVNAIVEDRYDLAMDEARAADARVRRAGSAPLPVLHGVPCTIKEAFALEGMPNTSGLVARKGLRAAEDATAVARLRAAGAIPIGVTNVSELCMWMESDNRVYGRTNNPYDPRHTAGGSSGGEGAIIGAGASPFGLGSDVGGSIRMPAYFNGVFGHKPTGGLVPGTLQYPNAEGRARRYVTTGPIARRAEDLMPLLRILAGPDGIDDCADITLEDPADVDLADLDVLVVESNGFIDPSPELVETLERAAGHLESLGARVRWGRFERLRHSLRIWASMLSAESATSFSTLLADGGELDVGRELMLWLAGRSEHTTPAIGLALVERLPAMRGPAAARWIEMGAELARELVDAMGPKGVMLYPPYARTVPRHGAPLRGLLHWIYTAILNVLELPSTAAPLGFDGAGLPLGIQIVAPHGADHRSIAVAMAIERGFGGWRPPPHLFQ